MIKYDLNCQHELYLLLYIKVMPTYYWTSLFNVDINVHFIIKCNLKAGNKFYVFYFGLSFLCAELFTHEHTCKIDRLTNVFKFKCASSQQRFFLKLARGLSDIATTVCMLDSKYQSFVLKVVDPICSLKM